jgi:hypothetical protein
MDWVLRIEKVENGFIASYRLDEETTLNKEVFQDDGTDDLKSGEEMLWFVLDHFGIGGSKHDPERIRIVREKRDE